MVHGKRRDKPVWRCSRTKDKARESTTFGSIGWPYEVKLHATSTPPQNAGYILRRSIDKIDNVNINNDDYEYIHNDDYEYILNM